MIKITRVVGIDPSWELSGAAMVGGAVPMLERFPVGGLLMTKTPNAEEDLYQMQVMAGRVVERVTGWIGDEPTLAVFEGPAMGAKFGRPDERAGIRWFIANALRSRHGARIAFVPPPTLKKFWTGDGKADKAQMVSATEARFPGMHIPDHNANDGFALAQMGAIYLGIAPVPGSPMVTLASLRGVRWPLPPQEVTPWH